MDLKPVTVHIAAMVDKLEDDPVRAVYMTVKELYRLQCAVNKTIAHDPAKFNSFFQHILKERDLYPEEMRKYIMNTVEKSSDAMIEQLYLLLMDEVSE